MNWRPSSATQMRVLSALVLYLALTRITTWEKALNLTAVALLVAVCWSD